MNLHQSGSNTKLGALELRWTNSAIVPMLIYVAFNIYSSNYGPPAHADISAK